MKKQADGIQGDTLVISWRIGEASQKQSVYEWRNDDFVEIAQENTETNAGNVLDQRQGQEDISQIGLHISSESETQVEANLLAEMRVNTLFPAAEKVVGGTRWGYINSQGNFVLPAEYDYANNFQHNGLAIVQLKGKNGIINQAGHFVVKPMYEWITNFSEGRAAASDEKGYKVIDEKGKVITRRTYDYIGQYSHSRATFLVTDEAGTHKYGYLDRQGNEVIPARFEDAGDFTHGGKAVVQLKDHLYALIDRNGKQLHTYPYAYVGPLSEGLLSYREEQDGMSGYIDEAGKVVIPPRYVFALPFQEGRAVINTSGTYVNEYGLIDRKGNYIIEPKYNDINQIGEQRLAIGKARDPNQPFIGSMFALADMKGTLLTDFIFSSINDYKQGLASVSDTDSTYFINRDGAVYRKFPKVPGTGTLTLMGNVVQANVDQRLSYYDRSGRIIWSQNTVIPLTPPYKVKEEKYKPNKDYLVYYPQLEGMSNRAIQDEVNKKLKTFSQVKDVGTGQLDYSYTGDFDVTWFKNRLLVLELNAYNYPFGAAHGMPTKVHEHVNVVDGTFYSLAQLFKSDSHYVKVLSDIVGLQIKNDPQYNYVFPDTYKGISADQPFYVKEDALYLYFAPYEIAPYVAGFPTFRIPFSEIMNLINTKGEFWKSFH